MDIQKKFYFKPKETYWNSSEKNFPGKLNKTERCQVLGKYQNTKKRAKKFPQKKLDVNKAYALHPHY